MKEKLLKINKNKFVILLSLLFIAISWFIFTHITNVNYGDDYVYMHFSYDSSKRIKSLYDVLKSQYWQYFNWGGRSIINATAQIFYMFDKVVFDVFNSLIFTGTVYIIYSFRKNKENNFLLLMFIFLSFWFFCGDLFRIFIWEVACFNYGWPIFFSLLFIKIYFSDNYYIKNNIVFSILFFIFSFLVGWGHEAISPVVFVSVVLYLLYKVKNKISIYKLELLGFIGHTIGLSFLLFAPGNFVRYNAEKSLFYPFDIFPLSKYLFALYRNGHFLIHYLMPLIIVMALVIIYSYKTNLLNHSITKDYKLYLTYYIFIFLFASFFTFIMLSYANSIVITSLVISLIIIVRYIDYGFIDRNIDYFFVIIIMLLVLYLCQASATIYYVMTKSKIIEHGFKLVS